MKGFLLLILGIFLINSFFSFIPTVAPDVELATYLPYQCWFNILIILSWLLPGNTAEYLFEKELEPIPSEKDSSESSSSKEPSVPPTASTEPSTLQAEPSTVPAQPSALTESSTEPSAPPAEPMQGGYKSPKVKRKRKRRKRKILKNKK